MVKKSQIRISALTEMNNSKSWADKYVETSSVDESWRMLVDHYNDQIAKGKEVLHIFFKGEGQFDKPSEATQKYVEENVGRYRHFN